MASSFESLTSQRRRLDAGEVSSRELVAAALERAGELDASLNAMVALRAEAALGEGYHTRQLDTIVV